MTCPTNHAFERLIAGDLSAHDEDLIERHAESCDACARRLGASAGDSLVSELRAALRAEAAPKAPARGG